MTSEQFVFWLSGLVSICDPEDASVNHAETLKKIIGAIRLVNNGAMKVVFFGAEE